MVSAGDAADHAPMSSSTAAAATRRLVLVPASPRADQGGPTVRRFRFARLRLEGRDVPPAERFDHVKRSYD
jgi:hypothetical protein